MTATRVLRTASATLQRTFYLGETPADSSTPVTVTVTDATGAVVTTGTATSSGPDTGTYQYTLPGQAQLARLTAAWAATIGGTAVSAEEPVEVVGGFFFTLAEARASDESLADTTRYPTAAMAAARQDTEAECEAICGRAFVPRYRLITLDGSGTSDLLLPDGGDELVAGSMLRGVRTVRSARIAPRVGFAFTPLTTGQLAALAVTRDGMLRRTDGGIWTEGVRNVVLEYEYGSDAPPAEIRRAALQRFRWLLTAPRSGIPDRATSFQAAEGGVYELDTAGASRTGIPDVDAAYLRYARGGQGDGQSGGRSGRPASRPLNFDPQHYSLFHGGVR
ncbi:hypothetical protein Ssi03_62650 [Sphaerisporangium siamense]|uniref:Uncharacterized protein n=1 Tax=Sphaerisporangium siamense TaxID=795645 RepID=A0A7W7DBZ8_9ACTN|nr:hypothetical protein [Sphaerisporangium siamense]MBB4702573.1 hypothetical protein [Sphaerisporangium siamense]GII88275.1 hypothetical protein Ssi03_62650 [Sphaerisporangium siamense]